jgi:hypothetical protein
VDSPEVLSLAELSRRLSSVRSGEAHLRTGLPPDNPHNAILRLLDITRYIGVPMNRIFEWFPTMSRVEHRLRDRPAPKKAKPIPEEWQRELSRFFYAWDRGTLKKAQVGGEWQIIGRHQTSPQMDVTPRPQAPPRVLTMRIDLTTLGPRLKGS